MAQTVASQVTFHQPRTPATYHGDVFEDVEDWLEQLERVASFIQGDPEQKLRNAYYSLDDGARTWFENRVDSLLASDKLRPQLQERFASTDHLDRAQWLL